MFRMEDVLKEIGWSSELSFPIANEANKKLESELQRLHFAKAMAKSSYERACSQFEALSKHLKYAEQELEQNQKLITAHAQQLNDERHKLTVAEAEKQRVLKDIKRLNRDVQDATDKQLLKRADLKKNLIKLEKLKSETEWDLGALDAWNLSLKNRDIDNDLLKQFSKEDECKTKELEVKRENLQTEVVDRHALVQKIVAEMTSYEQVIERTSKIFKQQTEERGNLISRWHDAVNNLRQRDHNIQSTSKQITTTQEDIARHEEVLREENVFLNNEKNNNKSIQSQITTLNVTSSLQRQALSEVIQDCLTLANEVNSERRIVYGTSQRLEAERGKRRDLENESTNLQVRITKTEEKIAKLRVTLEEVNNSALDSNQNAKLLEERIDNEKKFGDSVVVDTERCQSILYKSRLVLNKEKDITKTKQIQVSAAETSVKVISKCIQGTVHRLMRQKEVIYTLDYRINELEIKIAELEGMSKEDDVSEAANIKIAELERTLAEHVDVKNYIHGHVVRLEEEMRRLGVAISAEGDRLETLRGQLHYQVLHFEGGLKQAAVAKLKSQNLQVEENVLRLKVSQLNKSMAKEDDSIYDLHRFRIELEAALRERQIEIGTHKEVLFAERKNLMETSGRFKADLKKRSIRIEQFKKRYHLTLMTLGTDPEGQPLSVTYFEVKNAQEKYMLQQEIDEVLTKTKKAEREILGMENTLKVVSATNVCFKSSLATIGQDSEENTELRRLEAETIKTNLALRQVKKALAKKRQQLDELKEILQNCNSERQELGENLMRSQDSYCLLKKDEASRIEKLHRANKQIKHLRKGMVAATLEKPEKNLTIQYLQDVHKAVLKIFQKLHSQHEDLSVQIEQYFARNALELPGSPSTLSISSGSKSSEPRNVASSTNSCLSQVVLSFAM